MDHSSDGHGEHGKGNGGGFIAVIAIAVFVIFYLAGWVMRSDPPQYPTHRPVAGPGYSEPLAARGPVDAKVVITEVADFKCRYCAHRHLLMKRLFAEHEGKVRFVFKHFPFVNPVSSEEAAIASMAASRQGRFWGYVDQLYLHQPEAWDTEAFGRYAVALGLDLGKFNADRQDPALLAYVRADKAAAEALSVRATPTLFVNGRQAPNDANADTIRMMVREAEHEVQGILDRGEAKTVTEARSLASALRHPMGQQFARFYIDNDVTDLNISLRVDFRSK